jgi:hypothetical protein
VIIRFVVVSSIVCVVGLALSSELVADRVVILDSPMTSELDVGSGSIVVALSVSVGTAVEFSSTHEAVLLATWAQHISGGTKWHEKGRAMERNTAHRVLSDASSTQLMAIGQTIATGDCFSLVQEDTNIVCVTVATATVSVTVHAPVGVAGRGVSTSVYPLSEQ